MAKNIKDNKNRVGDDSKNFSLVNSRHQKKYHYDLCISILAFLLIQETWNTFFYV